jgi:hypothetical protein
VRDGDGAVDFGKAEVARREAPAAGRRRRDFRRHLHYFE